MFICNWVKDNMEIIPFISFAFLMIFIIGISIIFTPTKKEYEIKAYNNSQKWAKDLEIKPKAILCNGSKCVVNDGNNVYLLSCEYKSEICYLQRN
jgi:hypothetical protein